MHPFSPNRASHMRTTLICASHEQHYTDHQQRVIGCDHVHHHPLPLPLQLATFDDVAHIFPRNLYALIVIFACFRVLQEAHTPTHLLTHPPTHLLTRSPTHLLTRSSVPRCLLAYSLTHSPNHFITSVPALLRVGRCAYDCARLDDDGYLFIHRRSDPTCHR